MVAVCIDEDRTMNSNHDKIRELAQAAYSFHELPDDLIIDDHDGFTSEDNGAQVELSRRFYCYAENEGDEDAYSLIAYFNIRINSDTLDIEDAYSIASAGGVMFGSFTEASRKKAYAWVGLEDPRTDAAAAP